MEGKEMDDVPSLNESKSLGLTMSKMVMMFSLTPCSEKYLRSLSSRSVLWTLGRRVGGEETVQFQMLVRGGWGGTQVG
jgi:hypothetical protein